MTILTAKQLSAEIFKKKGRKEEKKKESNHCKLDFLGYTLLTTLADLSGCMYGIWDKNLAKDCLFLGHTKASSYQPCVLTYYVT